MPNIISLGTEQNLFNKDSKIFKRIQKYSKDFEKYYCLVFTKNKNIEKIQFDNFIIVPIYGNNKLVQIFNLFKIIKKINLKSENTIISSQDPFEIGLLSFLISKKNKYKLHIQIHTDISSPYFKKESFRNHIQYVISKFIIKKANSIRVVSNRIQKYLINDLSISEKLIDNIPIHTDKIKELKKINLEKITNKKINILSISRFSKVKNIPKLIESYTRLRNQNINNLGLIIIGDGKEKNNIVKEINKSDYKENIIILPWSKDPMDYMYSADIFSISSNYEGWAMTAVESVLAETPVVMTDVGCANEFIFNEINGVIAENMSVNSYTLALKKSLDLLNNKIINKETLKKITENLDTEEVYINKIKENILKSLN